MDDDGSDDFSRAIVEGFLEQAQDTFDKMDQSLFVHLTRTVRLKRHRLLTDIMSSQY
jgi:hypothetical protein